MHHEYEIHYWTGGPEFKDKPGWYINCRYRAGNLADVMGPFACRADAERAAENESGAQ